MKKKLTCLLLLLLAFTACNDFFVKDIADDQVEIVAPKNNVVVNSNEITLVWEALDGAESYRVIVVSPSFSEVLYYACDSITESYKVDVSLPNGTYEWSVQASNSAYTSFKTYAKFQISAK